MTAALKNVYINKLDELIDNYNKTFHRTIKMKPADVKHKFKASDRVRITKYKNTFTKWYLRIGLRKSL